jgi:anti-sigma-K factor RskA
MNYDNPDRADALAAQYVLGTMPARARARFTKLLRDNQRLRSAVADWEERLMPFADAIPPVNPPERVWAAILSRIGVGTRSPPAPVSIWSNLGLWRGLTLAGFATALALAVVLFGPRPELAPDPLVVVLAGPDNKPALVASGDRNGRVLTVKAVGAPEPAADRSFELWAIPTQGNPRSLGVLPASGVARITLPTPAGSALQNIKALAVSIEARGGSTTGLPQGPVVYSGPIQQLF